MVNRHLCVTSSVTKGTFSVTGIAVKRVSTDRTGVRRAGLRAVAFLILAGGCGMERPSDRATNEAVGGSVVIAAFAEPTSLLPPFVSQTSEKQIADQIFDPLAEIGPDLNTLGDAGWTPRLARAWHWSADSLAITFELNPAARWHDGVPVRANDVRFSWELYRDPAVAAHGAANLQDVDSVSTRDSLTAVVWFRRRTPEQFFHLVSTLYVLPEHLLRGEDRRSLRHSAFAQRPVGSGPFRLVRWEPRSLIEVEANTAYHLGRPLLDRVVWTLTPDPVTATSKLIAGDADFVEMLNAEGLRRIGGIGHLRAVSYRGFTQGYLVFNMRSPRQPLQPHPLFAVREMRVALTMALDRRTMLATVLDSLGAPSYGPFAAAHFTADTTIPQIPFDTSGSNRLLDSLGWRQRDRDGVRMRAGQRLEFSLLVPTSSLPRRRYAVMIQEQLRHVGVKVKVEELDPSAMAPLMVTGKFDAALHAVQSEPSPSSIRDAWKSVQPGSRRMNVGAYSSPLVDALIDSATSEFSRARAIQYYQRAYRAIVDDAPAVWLYELRPRAGVHVRIRTLVDRADTWWRDIRLWWIPPSERIDRDRLGLRVANR